MRASLALGLLALQLLGQTPEAPGQAQRDLREGRLEQARAGFERRLSQAPKDADALVGAGFTALRQDRTLDGKELFSRVLALAPGYSDAHFGLALALERLGQIPEAKRELKAALALEPKRAEFQQAMARVQLQDPDLPPIRRPEALDLGFRVNPGGFEVRQGNRWTPIFIKGINLGAALPGKYPSEFPDLPVYQGWLKDMADLGVNAIRVYTIHPPAFYAALREHNLHTAHPIYLIHGVWTELPPDDDFRNGPWLAEWTGEMQKVVDLLHGHGWIKPRPGHASGIYLADVSSWTIAYILGREWEPFSVSAFNERHPGRTDFRGRFLTVRQGHATETFMAEALESLLGYEHDTYHAQRPAAFTNWPTLDPLDHPTEATKEEEAALRAKLGLSLDKGQVVREFDNDAESLDMERFDETPLYAAGLFASYHAYPYYPDFMNLDPGYGRSQDSQGPNNYFGYLQELVHFHRKHPVLISEFGVPSSRLVAHWQAQGMTHGGQDEREQGLQDARLFRNIYDSGCAGGVLFAWIDEWFKKNWLVIDFEEPLERKPLWYNVEDAEENYGLIGMRPGTSGPHILIDGHPEDWKAVPAYLTEPGLTLKLLADEGWLHLAIFFDGDGPPKALKEGFLVGLDTFDSKLGDHQLPFGLPLKSAAGLEFAVLFQGQRADLYADYPYDLFSHRYNRPYRTVDNQAGHFVLPRTESNRLRIGRDGTVFPVRRQEIGHLTFGTQDRLSPQFDSRAEWNAGPGFIEARIPWGLLNVTDPSSRRVVQESAVNNGVGTVQTDGFRAVLVRCQGEPGGPLTALRTLPAASQGLIPIPPLFTWPEWQQPTFHGFRKDSFGLVQEGLRALPEQPKRREP